MTNCPENDRLQEPTEADKSGCGHIRSRTRSVTNKSEWISKSENAGRTKACMGNIFQSREKKDSSIRKSKTGLPHIELTQQPKPVKWTPRYQVHFPPSYFKYPQPCIKSRANHRIEEVYWIYSKKQTGVFQST